MTSWNDILGMGQLMQPTPQASQQPSMLADPTLQAALLSFGLQAMNGGWGNATQQAAQAIGAGAQGAGAYTAQQQERDRYEESLNQAEAERANRRGIAQLGADSRREIAALRAEHAAGNADIRLQLNTANNRWRAEAALEQRYNTLVRSANENILLTPEQRAAQIEAARLERDRMRMQIQLQYPMGGDALPGGNAVPPAPAPAPAPGPGGSGARRPGALPPANRPVVPPAAPPAAGAIPIPPSQMPLRPMPGTTVAPSAGAGGVPPAAAPAAPVIQSPPPVNITPQALAMAQRDLAAARNGDAGAYQRIQSMLATPAGRELLAYIRNSSPRSQR